MDSSFLDLINDFDQKCNELLSKDAFMIQNLPRLIRGRGIYLISEAEKHLYVGRTNNIRRRLQNHCRPSAGHNQATLAFLIARKATGNVKASYNQSNSRKELLKDVNFKQRFELEKNRIRKMDVRFIEENNPLRQALFEIYVAVRLETPYNDFENH